MEGEIPLPALHHVLWSAALLEDADQSLHSAIDSEDVSDACRGGGEVREVIERVDEWKRGCAVQSAAVVQGCGDADRSLVGIGNAEVDFPHLL